MEERLEEAMTYFEDYRDKYPEGEFIEQAKTYSDDIVERQIQIKSNIQNQ
jgi:hypothetical protein